jgi:hypothetical protein
VAKFMARFHDQGVEEVVLIVGEHRYPADCADPVPVQPREIVESYMDAEWMQGVKRTYERPTEELYSGRMPRST